MRRLVCLATVLALLTGAARATEPADVKKVIEKAIKAAGGEEKLAQFNTETIKLKGKFYGIGDGIDYTGTWDIQLPDKMRFKIEGGDGDMKFTFLRVTNGKKVWDALMGDVKEEDDKDKIAEAQERIYADHYVTSLLPLVKEKGFTLAALGEVKVGDKPAVGVRVSHKGHRDVNLFFDKDKGLLVKSETTVKDDMTGGKEQPQETLYSQYKDVKGALRPMSIVINRDGKKFVEDKVTEEQPKEKFEDSVFAKP